MKVDIWTKWSKIEQQTGQLRANTNLVDGEVKDKITETTLAENEVADFKKDWEDNWYPMIGEQSIGIMKTFFKKLDKFL